MRIPFFLLVGIASLWQPGNGVAQAPNPNDNVVAGGVGPTTPTRRNAIEPGYLLFPIMPGGANSLSGGLGDLRGNHFHAGLDIRTQGREGLAVHAAADGYVSRIAVFTGGYGNVLFIKHPNGLTTVYGHLKTLGDTLGRYLRQQQYARQTFEIDLRPQPGQFPVRKGDVVALSGNTGGSGGPHLHFEVRDAADNLLNPVLFGFPELTDNVPPYFERIALRTLTPDSRVNGEHARLVVTPIRRPDGSYGIAQPITAAGLLGLELLGYDKTTGSPYRNGLSCVEVKLDGREVFAYNMDSFPHDQTRFINVHMNYEVEQLTGQRYHRCYVADGNELTLYKVPSNNAYRGRLPLFDGQPHQVTITLFDAYQNSAQLHFTILPDSTTLPTSDSVTPGVLKPGVGKPAVSITPDENLLKLTVRNLPAGEVPKARLFVGRDRTELPHSYVQGNQAVYLIDLRRLMPDSIQFGTGVLRTGLRRRVLPGRIDTYEEGNLRLNFGPRTLFDTLYLAVRQAAGNVVEINQHTIPLNDYVAVTYRPTDTLRTAPASTTSVSTAATLPVSTGAVSTGAVSTAAASTTFTAAPANPQERTHAYLTSGGRKKFIGGTWENGAITFRTRELGRFQLLTDYVPPKVQLLTRTANAIVAKISDDLSGIAQFRAFVNGEWVLMQYDYKRALIWSEKLDPAVPFQGDLVLQVKDMAGNVTTVNAVIP